MKVLKILMIIVILIIVLGACGYFTIATSMERATKRGTKQNEVIATTENIKDNPTIVYLGDSLTNGYLSDGELHAEDLGYRDNVDETLNATSYNYAVDGYTLSDVKTQFENDIELSVVNQEITARFPELESLYPSNPESDLPISHAVKQADYIILTIGANDVLESLLEFDEEGNFTVKKESFFKNLRAYHDAKYELLNYIHELNEGVQIYDVGMYFAYPHIGDNFMKWLYPVLNIVEHYIFIDEQKINVTKVDVKDNMQANIKVFVDNPSDIHPSPLGYDVMSNEILKAIDKAND